MFMKLLNPQGMFVWIFCRHHLNARLKVGLHGEVFLPKWTKALICVKNLALFVLGLNCPSRGRKGKLCSCSCAEWFELIYLSNFSDYEDWCSLPLSSKTCSSLELGFLLFATFHYTSPVFPKLMLMGLENNHFIHTVKIFQEYFSNMHET